MDLGDLIEAIGTGLSTLDAEMLGRAVTRPFWGWWGRFLLVAGTVLAIAAVITVIVLLRSRA